MAGGYSELANERVSAANGIDYVYHQVGEGTPALVLLQHFRQNLHNWDPALVDARLRSDTTSHDVVESHPGASTKASLYPRVGRALSVRHERACGVAGGWSDRRSRC